MAYSLKPLDQQRIIITGATSGIGLVTTRRLAGEGATLVLAARNDEALRKLAEECRGRGARATHVVADVGREEDVGKIAKVAVDAFGGFDTWINNAGVSIYGRLDEVEIADMRRLFDTNFWGVVYGSRAAVAHFKESGGGKLINMGSVLGERAIPIQGIYSASKHAVAGFTEALRIEMDTERLPIFVTLIKPSAIDTPYKDHAKNYLDEAPKNPPPVYEPETVARAILYACTHDIRDIVVGGGGQLISSLSNFAPRMADRVMARAMPYLQRSRHPPGPRERHSLYHPQEDLSERSDYPFALKHSAYTRFQMQPGLTTLAVLAAGAGIAALSLIGSSSSSPRSRRH